MKGIILAGGTATRLYPVTKGISKHFLPVYDKPMIYYPLSVLMLSGIRQILIISTERDLPGFRELFGDGRQLGLTISYLAQPKPQGIAAALLVAAEFIDNKPVCLILGDNLFYGNNLIHLAQDAAKTKKGATLFAYYVKDPQRYGVIEFGPKYRPLGITEKPRWPKSNWVVTGLYYYAGDVVEIARTLRPSARGELEISAVNNEYLRRGEVKVKLLGRGHAWLDTGTPDALIDASVFIKTIEERQGLKVGCIEEIAYRMGFISRAQLQRLIAPASTGPAENSYNNYLKGIFRQSWP